MDDQIINISFDRKKGPAIDFEIMPVESILQRANLMHDPRDLHKVNFYLLILITSGRGKHTIDFEEYDLAPGSVLTIRKDQIQSFHNGNHRGFMLLFTEEYVLSYLDSKGAGMISELFNELLFHQHSQLSDSQFQAILTIVRQIEEEFHQSLDAHTPGVIRNFLQILVSKIHRVRSAIASLQPDHKYTVQFLEFQHLIEGNYHNSRAVKYYADRLNVTTKTLNNITQRILRKPAKQFIDDIIILKIKRSLINTDLSIKQIAYQSGFEEPSNLFKFFKRYAQQTPEKFRQSHSTKE